MSLRVKLNDQNALFIGETEDGEESVGIKLSFSLIF